MQRERGREDGATLKLYDAFFCSYSGFGYAILGSSHGEFRWRLDESSKGNVDGR